MISARQLTRRFGARAVVADVSFDVSKSEIVALLGPNGAGKTTLIRTILDIINPTAVASKSSVGRFSRPTAIASGTCPKNAVCIRANACRMSSNISGG
jgi:ABC-type multidrug transport system ATPase subunit